jgi:hypothetical protein
MQPTQFDKKGMKGSKGRETLLLNKGKKQIV